MSVAPFRAERPEDYDAIAQRPYFTLYRACEASCADAERHIQPGELHVVATPPHFPPEGYGGGPVTVGAMHPIDYYACQQDEQGRWIATANCGDLPSA